MDSENIIDALLNKSRLVLKKYPLCDHCLGRLFARLGVGLGNDTRGRSIKTMLSLILHYESNTKPDARNEIREIAVNAGEPLTSMYKALYSEVVERRTCYVCGSKLSRGYFESIASRAYESLGKLGIKRFLVGVSLSKDTRMRELEVQQLVGMDWAESIKNEVKREVGKNIRDKFGLTPDFENPEAVVIIDFEKDHLKIQLSSIYIEGVYWKKARHIPQAKWLGRDASIYPLSLESFLNEKLSSTFGSEKIFIHASGREDIDVRMIGTGRPVVIELYKPLRRQVELREINELLYSDLIEFRFTNLVKRSRVIYLKTTSRLKKKTYKVLIYSYRTLTDKDMERLERFYETNKVIKQSTPTRVLNRRRDIVRLRRVHEIKSRLLTPHVFETIIKCDGGLYVKELVHGDNGRTQPSFSDVLESPLIPLELDTIEVEIG